MTYLLILIIASMIQVFAAIHFYYKGYSKAYLLRQEEFTSGLQKALRESLIKEGYDVSEITNGQFSATKKEA